MIGFAKHLTSIDILSGIQSAITAAVDSCGSGQIEVALLTPHPAFLIPSWDSCIRCLPASLTITGCCQRYCMPLSPPDMEGTFLADCANISACMLGTTHFVNACVQRRGLARVALFRLCGPATHGLPPFCDLPDALKQSIGNHYSLLDGQCSLLFGCTEIEYHLGMQLYNLNIDSHHNSKARLDHHCQFTLSCGLQTALSCRWLRI